MKPETQSLLLLGATKSKGKMYEYFVPLEDHIALTKDPATLFALALGIIGDYSAISDLNESDSDQIDSLLFSSQYLDSYIQSKLNQELDPYLYLIGSAAYYLSNLPGSSSVLVNKIGETCPDLECDGLESLLWQLLSNNYSTQLNSEFYSDKISPILDQIARYYETGKGAKELINQSQELRKYIYENGSPRELIVTDIFCAVLKKKINNSSWNSLEKYTDVSIDNWKETITKKTFIKEFWPAQQLLGEKDLFKGKSSIIQMPTSAGKTKSIEIIIRSNFLSGRAQLAVIIAPFRALCAEIKNNLTTAFEGENIEVDAISDTLQVDFDTILDMDLDTRNLVLVLTPEKLMYMVRHQPELAEKIGLIIYDEGHQFDSGIRGVTYELLLSSLKRIIPSTAQIILISAVISNAEAIGGWLIGEGVNIVSGTNLSPTYRTIAFASWKDLRGRLEFVNTSNPDVQEYFVPRVIEQTEIAKKGRETKIRYFPEKEDGNSIALYLGLKLVNNGSVALFCGSKLTVLSLCIQALDLFSRGYKSEWPINISDNDEVRKLSLLLEKNFGSSDVKTSIAKIGIFGHSGNTPQGIRLAIEHAMQKSKIKFIICTSTLAQGVNLPIKYLIVTSVYQGGKKIKTRDFHNLIGRAGRAGMYTEGSVLFGDPEIYDKQNSRRDSWRWSDAKKILDQQNSEPCISTLSSVFDKIYSEDEFYSIDVNPLDFVKAYIESAEKLRTDIEDFAETHADKKFTKAGLAKQLDFKIEIIAAIESYLMAYLEAKTQLDDQQVSDLARGTLAYFLATEERKTEILELFRLLATNVNIAFADPEKRKAFGKTLLGVRDLQDIENWTLEKLKALFEVKDSEHLLQEIWPILSAKIRHENFGKVIPEEHLYNLALDWIKGKPYFELHEEFIKNEVKIRAGTQQRQPQQDTVIDICDNGLAFDGTLIIAAISEIVSLQKNNERQSLINKLNELQKRLKYGLPNRLSIAFYEIGFADRSIALELSSRFIDFSTTKNELIAQVKKSETLVREEVNNYPEYYINVLNEIIANR